MSLRANHLAHHVGNTGFPVTGGGTNKTTSKKQAPAKRVSAEQKAEQARLDDPYGDHGGAGRTQRGGGRTRVVRRRVRRRRVGTQKSQSQFGASTSGKAGQTGQTKAQAKGQAAGQTAGQNSNRHMESRMSAQGNLAKMSSQFTSGQTNSGPKTPGGQKMHMLQRLRDYVQGDYAAMKAGNEKDTAFTYRTSEARQLVATLGSMVRSTKKDDKKDTKDSKSDNKGLSAAAFGRQKGLLRHLKAMSDPSGPMPEGLPPDYQPFESVA
jgi:hypothetical protein